jgi:hypothetical protein
MRLNNEIKGFQGRHHTYLSLCGLQIKALALGEH